MASVTPVLKNKNKTKPEQPLWVVLRHRNPDSSRVEVTIIPGINIRPEQFKKGKVTGEDSIAWNELVAQVSAELYKALEIVTKDTGGWTTVALVKEEYNRIVQARIAQDKADKMFWTGPYQHKKDAHYATKRINRLNRDMKIKLSELEEMQTEVERMHTKLEIAEAKDGKVVTKNPYKPEDLYVTYVKKFLGEKKNNHQGSTHYTYEAIITLVTEFNPRLRIQEVNRTTMYELEDFLIKKGRLNTTIENYTSKIKGILNYYQADLNLNLGYKQYRFELPTYDNDVLYFSLDQLQDFWQHQKGLKTYEKQPGRTTNRGYERVKDLMMFMVGTSLRYVDIFEDFSHLIKRETDRTGKTTEFIEMMPRKTRRKHITVRIPLTPLVKSILVRHNYQFKRMRDDYFRDILREFCEDIPSFQQEVTWFEFVGQTKVMDIDPVTGKKPLFWEKIGAHTARRTWINMAIQSEWLQSEVMGVTGHTDMNTLALYYSKAKVIRGQHPLNFFERTY